jgi:hypothetical protein
VAVGCVVTKRAGFSEISTDRPSKSVTSGVDSSDEQAVTVREAPSTTIIMRVASRVVPDPILLRGCLFVCLAAGRDDFKRIVPLSVK